MNLGKFQYMKTEESVLRVIHGTSGKQGKSFLHKGSLPEGK